MIFPIVLSSPLSPPPIVSLCAHLSTNKEVINMELIHIISIIQQTGDENTKTYFDLMPNSQYLLTMKCVAARGENLQSDLGGYRLMNQTNMLNILVNVSWKLVFILAVYTV